MTFTAEQVRLSLDNHFLSGCPSLDAAQLGAHRKRLWCDACVRPVATVTLVPPPPPGWEVMIVGLPAPYDSELAMSSKAASPSARRAASLCADGWQPCSFWDGYLLLRRPLPPASPQDQP